MTDALVSQARFVRRPLGVSLLVGFFCFGLAMCSLTVILLLFPGSPLDIAWRIKLTARAELSAFGVFTIPLMILVGMACGSAAVGLAKGAEWGRQVAIGVLAVNLMGDTANAVVRGDWHTLIGLPIGGLMIAYLISRRVRPFFRRSGENVA